MSKIPVNLVYEDSLSESVLRKLLMNSRQRYDIGSAYNSRGYGWIKVRINGLNNAAKGMPYIVLTDLDVYQCPPVLINAWLPTTKHHNLILRVAVRETESWLLACRSSFAEFLGVSEDLIPTKVDEITQPKHFLVDLARKSRHRSVRADIVPDKGSTARVGPDYNGRLIWFVEKLWDPNIAKNFSPSLASAAKILDEFQPIFET